MSVVSSDPEEECPGAVVGAPVRPIKQESMEEHVLDDVARTDISEIIQNLEKFVLGMTNKFGEQSKFGKNVKIYFLRL